MPVIYEDKICKNPCCALITFTPRRPNQEFCDLQCKDYYNNQKKKTLKETTFEREAHLRKNQQKLAALYQNPAYKNEVSEIILTHEGVSLTLFTDQEVITATRRRILWSHNYGLELLSSSLDIYRIHQR